MAGVAYRNPNVYRRAWLTYRGILQTSVDTRRRTAVATGLNRSVEATGLSRTIEATGLSRSIHAS